MFLLKSDAFSDLRLKKVKRFMMTNELRRCGLKDEFGSRKLCP